jgi:hypothetical protein
MKPSYFWPGAVVVLVSLSSRRKASASRLIIKGKRSHSSKDATPAASETCGTRSFLNSCKDTFRDIRPSSQNTCLEEGEKGCTPHLSQRKGRWAHGRRQLAGHSRERAGLRVGGQSVGHVQFIRSRLFAWLLGLKEPKFVVGYAGPELDVALERGEIDARAAAVEKETMSEEYKKIVDFHAILEIPLGSRPVPYVPSQGSVPVVPIVRGVKTKSSNPGKSMVVGSGRRRQFEFC